MDGERYEIRMPCCECHGTATWWSDYVGEIDRRCEECRSRRANEDVSDVFALINQSRAEWTKALSDAQAFGNGFLKDGKHALPESTWPGKSWGAKAIEAANQGMRYVGPAMPVTDELRAAHLSAHQALCRNNAIQHIYFELLCAIDPSGALIPMIAGGADPREANWTDRESMLALIAERHAEGNAVRQERDELRRRLAERDESLVRAVRAK